MAKSKKKSLAEVKKAAREKGLLKPKERIIHSDGFKVTLPGKKTKRYNPDAKNILRRMRESRGANGMRYALGVGHLCKLARSVSGYRISGAFCGRTLKPGEIVMITSDPYNPMGDGLRVDIMAGADIYDAVRIKILRPFSEYADPDAHTEDEE